MNEDTMHTARLAAPASGYFTRGHLHLDDYRTPRDGVEAAFDRPRGGVR